MGHQVRPQSRVLLHRPNRGSRVYPPPGSYGREEHSIPSRSIRELLWKVPRNWHGAAPLPADGCLAFRVGCRNSFEFPCEIPESTVGASARTGRTLLLFPRAFVEPAADGFRGGT